MTAHQRTVDMYTGQCRACMRRRHDCFAITRDGGGTYRRGGRVYRSTICGECARRYTNHVGSYAGATVDRFDGRRIRIIAHATMAGHWHDDMVDGVAHYMDAVDVAGLPGWLVDHREHPPAVRA